MTKKEEVSKMIKKHGKPTRWTSRGSVEVAVVRCQGCGEEIKSDNCDEVDYSISKRATVSFWHSGCFDKIWSHGIV